jgi:signal transduction histidine kinase
MTDQQEPARVLVVDDTDAARFIKAQVLRRAGFLVMEARTGTEALARAKTFRPDVAVLDVNLPDIHGLEVCRRLKEEASTPTIQVLQVSQTAITDTDRARGLDAGADMYLIDPIGPPVLVATVRSLLRIRRTEALLSLALEREREAREEAEHANRMKDNFVAMVSHELRTPLNAMSGWIWQLRQGHLTEEHRQRALEVLERNAKVQAQLIDDLLDASRMSTGKLEIELRPVSLPPIVKAAVEAALESPVNKRKRVAVHVSRCDEPIVVMGDPARLQQVIINIVNNAVQFTPQDGVVDVSCSLEDGHAVIRVRDNGVGIDPAFLPHVFERFRQARALGTGPERGLGLGLAIVQHLTARHGGEVKLESAGIGLGTTCTITLPVLDANAARPDEPAKSEPASLHGLRLLVVEDDPDARDALLSILEGYGAAVVGAETGASAEAIAVGANFDVLVSDVGLPDFSGSDLVRRLRASGQPFPAVAVTAFATAEERRRLMADGFQAHVAKPIDPERLAQAVVASLKSRP